MSLLEKIVDGFRSDRDIDHDDYFLDEDYYDEDDGYDEEPVTALRSRTQESDGTSSVRKGFFGGRNNVVSVTPPAMQVTMKKPKSINDSKNICDDLLDGKAVVINLEGINSEAAQRIIDFTYGAVYSIDGDLQGISKYIFMASPHSVELSGDFAGSFGMDSSASRERPEVVKKSAGGFRFNG